MFLKKPVIKIPERQIQKVIIEYLSILERQGKLYFFRANSGMVRLEHGGMLKTGRLGCPDLICCINGKFYGLEVKTATDKMSEGQEQAKKMIENCGGYYFVVRSIDDVRKIIEEV